MQVFQSKNELDDNISLTIAKIGLIFTRKKQKNIWYFGKSDSSFKLTYNWLEEKEKKLKIICLKMENYNIIQIKIVFCFFNEFYIHQFCSNEKKDCIN